VGLGSPDYVADVAVAGAENNHEVVVSDLAGLDQPRVGPLPRILVVEHHRPTSKGLQFGDVFLVVEDLVVRKTG
jgi:hypothetical protein